MEPERWRRVEQLYHAAREHEGSHRLAFLEQTCSGDQALRQEVESLLARDGQADDFMEVPAMEVMAKAINREGSLPSREEPTLVGKTVSHYRILEKLGSGGMGEVYKAEDLKLHRPVALKFLSGEFTRDKVALERLRREARAASALSYLNICAIFDIDEDADPPFIVMEWLKGRTLKERIAAAPLSTREVIEFAMQITDALHAAHSAGVIHRDIKPANIFITEHSQIKVLDFGLAKQITLGKQPEIITGNPASALSHSTDHSLTSTGQMLGTVAYMSPEQVRAEKLDARTDLFSFGAVLYEMATGQPAFFGSTAGIILHAVLERQPASASKLNPAVPLELARVINKALEKDRERRYQSAAELSSDLRRLVPTAPALPRLSALQRASTLAVIGTAAILLIAVWPAWLLKLSAPRPNVFQQMKITRLTTTGKSRLAAISPDGKYVAHVLDDNGQESLWLRQVAATRDIQILKPAALSYLGLTFSKDGNYIYYVSLPHKENLATLFEIPILGGASRKLIRDVDSPISFSPDGKLLAFRRGYPNGDTDLVVTSSDGSGERRIATSKLLKEPFWGRPIWSPDGKSLAVVVSGTRSMDVVEVPVAGGTQRVISPSERPLHFIDDIAWLTDGRGLIVVGSELDSMAMQLWQLSYPTSKVLRITNDLNRYSSVSVTADSRSVVTLQRAISSSICIAPSGDLSKLRRVIPAPGRNDGLQGFAWTPDGRIVFAARSAEHWDLWTLARDGKNIRQLATDTPNNWQPAVSPDGRTIVFTSNRVGRVNLWKMDIDGGNAEQLTNGSTDYDAEISRDGKWVVYVSLGQEKASLLKVSIAGGEPKELGKSFFTPVISPDGKYIASITGSGGQVAILPIGGGDPVRTLDIPFAAPQYELPPLRWAPDGQALDYIQTRDEVSNLWRQPLSGGPPRELTHFTTEQIFNFAWSRDGKQLALARGSETSDVVLITNFR